MVIALAMVTVATVCLVVLRQNQPTAKHAEHSGSARSCIRSLAACGYPGAGVGDGAHGLLRPVSRSVVLSTPGQVYRDADVSGAILVTASHVTITNVRVTCECAGDQSGIKIYSGTPKRPITGTTITNSTIRGASQTRSGALGDGVLNAGGNTSTVAKGLYIYNSGSTDWNGPGAVSDSYMIVDTYVPGAHAEAIYEGGGGQGIEAVHDTLLNNQPQTAVVFNGSDYGPAQHDVVRDSILAGGGYMIYGGYGAGHPPPIDGPHIIGNRFARSPFGGYYEHGGSVAVSTWMDPPTIDWHDNYWDDNLHTADW